jgi:hypothetical protein
MQLSVLAGWLPRHDNICNNNNHHLKHSNKYSGQKPPGKSHLGAATWPFKVLPQKVGRWLVVLHPQGTLLESNILLQSSLPCLFGFLFCLVLVFVFFFFFFFGHVKKERIGAGEMAQQVRALTALPKVMSSNLSNHMVAHNHL